MSFADDDNFIMPVHRKRAQDDDDDDDAPFIKQKPIQMSAQADTRKQQRPLLIKPLNIQPPPFVAAEAVSASQVEDDAESDAMARMNLPTAFGGKRKRADTTPAAPPLPPPIPARSPQINMRAPLPSPPRSLPTPTVAPITAAPDDSDDEYGPAPPPSYTAVQSDSDDDSDDNETAPLPTSRLPIAECATLQAHLKSVSALAFDPAGSRLLTGALDYTVNMFDFNGMTAACNAFASVTPSAGQPIRQIRFTDSGDRLLLATGDAVVRVFDREMRLLEETARGDSYLHDVKHTRGHTTTVTSLCWDRQRSKSTCYSGSLDGTVRVWDSTNLKHSLQTVRMSAAARGVGVTAMSVSFNGQTLAAAVNDGSIRLFTIASNSIREEKSISKAHELNTITSSLLFSSDNITLWSRGGDGTVKIWDTRQALIPLRIIDNLPNEFDNTDIVWSPRQDFALTLTNPSSGGDGTMAFISSKTFEVERHALPVPVKEEDPSPSPARPPRSRRLVRVAWSAAINQIAVGAFDGTIHQMYDHVLSRRGIIQCLSRPPRKEELTANISEQVGPIITPHALPMFRDETMSSKKKRLRDRTLPKAAPNISDLDAPKKKSTTQYLLDQIISNKFDHRSVDLRQAILDQDVSNPRYTKAYTNTQPTPIFEEDDDDDDANNNSKIK